MVQSFLVWKQFAIGLPEKLRPSVICPIHGHIHLEFETDDTPRTYQKMNHNPINDYDEGMNIFASNKDQMISESLADTINSVEISKRIRDSIEFTSMTHSARESHKVVEKFKFSDAEISDAMVSEIRQLADTKLDLADDRVLVSSRLSSIKESKSPDKESQEESPKTNKLN